MSSTIVIYSSKYGTTELYANWIAKELKADLKEISEVKSYELIYYDTVIFGAPLYIGKLHQYNQMLNTMMLYPPKLFLIFAVGLKDPSEEYIQVIKKQNNIEDDEVFYFPGKLDYQHLTLLDKFLMRGLKAQIKKHQSLTDEEQRILNSFSHLVDETNRQFILPLIHYVQKNALL